MKAQSNIVNICSVSVVPYSLTLFSVSSASEVIFLNVCACFWIVLVTVSLWSIGISCLCFLRIFPLGLTMLNVFSQVVYLIFLILFSNLSIIAIHIIVA